MKALLAGAVSVAALLTVSTAYAGPIIDLTFDGINTVYPFSNDVFIQDYYNGGTASNGNSGPNYGIEFSSNALNLCLNSATETCSNTSKGGLGPSDSREGALFFLSGGSTFMNVAAGFDTGFAFNYSDVNTSGGFVNVWSGLDGTGTLLATINLSLTPSGCSGFFGAYCPFEAIGVSFGGTAKSVEFGGVANYVVFDDVTFGKSTPGTPEPSTWVMMMAGAAGVGLLARRRSKARVALA